MERKLTEKEIQNLGQILKIKTTIIGEYSDFLKVILPIFIFIIFIFLYSEIKLGNFLTYMGIAGLISVIAVGNIVKLQGPYKSIFNGKYTCFESEMKGSAKKTRGKVKKTWHYRYFVIATINGKNEEIRYEGKSFDRLIIGEKMIIIGYGKKLKKENCICFSYNELNEK